MQSPEVGFRRWYVEPLQTLRELPHGDGAFVAITVSCSIYERLAKTVIDQSGKKVSDQAFYARLASDFEVDVTTAEAFWQVIRNGVAHQGMPKSKDNRNHKLPPWRFNESFGRAMELCESDGIRELRIQPWLFTSRVIELWTQNIPLLDASGSFPWANIVE